MTYQEIVKAIESLPVAERDSLLELIRQQQIEQRRTEIAQSGAELREDVRMGTTAQQFETVEDLRSYLQVDSKDYRPDRYNELRPLNLPDRKSVV